MPLPENDNRADERQGATGQCPICGKPRAQKFRPFCSPRCADADLQRWLSGRYVIPAAEDDEGRADEERAADR